MQTLQLRGFASGPKIFKKNLLVSSKNIHLVIKIQNMHGSITSKCDNSYFLCVFRALQKSTSIPVHLSVSRTNEVGLPPGLRPKHNFTSTVSNGGHQTGLENNFYIYLVFFILTFSTSDLESQKDIQNILFKGNIEKGTTIPTL